MFHATGYIPIDFNVILKSCFQISLGNFPFFEICSFFQQILSNRGLSQQSNGDGCKNFLFCFVFHPNFFLINCRMKLQKPRKQSNLQKTQKQNLSLNQKKNKLLHLRVCLKILTPLTSSGSFPHHKGLCTITFIIALISKYH